MARELRDIFTRERGDDDLSREVRAHLARGSRRADRARRCARAGGPRGVRASFWYTVSRQTREVGIRIAIGAGRADVLRMTIGMGIRWLAADAAIGMAASYIPARRATKVAPVVVLRYE
jgi:hypothetical protein